MRVIRDRGWLLWVVISGYCVTWTFGLFVMSPLLLFFVTTGRVRVRGYWRLVGNVLRGRCLILTNHPTLLAETFILGALLFPWWLLVPRCFMWTMPDKKLLDQWKMPQWVRTALRCIEVSRTKRILSGRGELVARRVLRAHGVIVAHPEMGRTRGEVNRGRTPLKEKNREMQEIRGSRLVEIAYETGACIVPGWVSVPYYREVVSIGTSFKRLIGPWSDAYLPITFHFGQPAYKPEAPFNLARENKRLQEKIFRA